VNPRQRRGILLMVLSGIAALAVFLGLSAYVSNVNSQVGAKVTVYQASGPIAAYTTLGLSNLQPKSVPKRWVSGSAVESLSALQGQQVGINVSKGTVITGDMLVPSSDLTADQREIAIDVNAETGVAGQVQPNDYVDIFAVFSDVEGLPKQVRVLVKDVKVLSVGGQKTVTANDSTREAQDVIPVTLALSPNDALAVTYASAFAQEVRLVKLPTGTQDRAGSADEYDADQLGGKSVPVTGK
jgi:pilus assembly protein CpaB